MIGAIGFQPAAIETGICISCFPQVPLGRA